MKTPPPEAFETAIAWLLSNEGDNGESDRCAEVAAWLEAQETNRAIKTVSRSSGLRVSTIRAALRSRM